MSKREWRLFLEDMLESIGLLNNYVEGMEFSGFKKDRKTVDAVVRNLEIIGEASRFIPEPVKQKYLDVDWKGIIGLRNRIAHEYFGVDLAVIWNIVKQELPKLEAQVKHILEKEKK